MARQHDAVIVVDIESTCWEGAPPKGQVSDIIEVGICLLDLSDLSRSGKRSLLLAPPRSEVSAFCTKLTTLRPEDLKSGLSLAEVCRILKQEYQSKDRLWASYGDYDRRQFEQCCAELGVPYPFGKTHLNIKSLLSSALGLKREPGMAQALEVLGLPLEGTHHRGHDDAWNIAGILAHLYSATRAGLALPDGRGRRAS